METITLPMAEIVKILNKGFYKGTDVKHIGFRTDKGLNMMQIELGFENYNLLVVSEETINVRVNNLSKTSYDVSNANFFLGQSLYSNCGHYKSIVSTLAKTKKDKFVEIVLFNGSDLFRELGITSHEMYINLYDSKDKLERHLVDKFVGIQNGASPLHTI